MGSISSRGYLGGCCHAVYFVSFCSCLFVDRSGYADGVAPVLNPFVQEYNAVEDLNHGPFFDDYVQPAQRETLGQPLDSLSQSPVRSLRLDGERPPENSAAPSPTLSGAPTISIPSDPPQSLTSTPAVASTDSIQTSLTAVPDASSLLSESRNIQTVEVRRRSPIDMDPHIRGYQLGQIHTQGDGAFWTPVRMDLDTMLSKLDPTLLEDVTVIPGPYGLRYGPGLAFIDVRTEGTPRYDSPEFHHRLGLTTRTNGGQFYGRETVFGGGKNWGMLINYGNRTGSDYSSGNGQLIPSSYHAQNFLGHFGFDVDDSSTLEFRYGRLDQTDTEYAGQFFDVDFLGSDSFTLNFANEDPCGCYDKWQVDAWYNRSRFTGDTRNQSKVDFNVINRVSSALGADILGETNGATTSLGARNVINYTNTYNHELSFGHDFRYVRQGLKERYSVATVPVDTQVDTNMPTSASFDPGLFAEWGIPWHPYWKTFFGARADWVHMEARTEDVRFNSALPNTDDDLDSSDVLYAFYATNDVQLTEYWTTRFGFGHAQRAPTLTERYADGLFLGVIQSGFSRLIGTPSLSKERAWQMDWSVERNLEHSHLRASVFHSWILDYVTYQGNVISDPSGARLLRTINTDLATLAGGEVYAERDISSQLAAFGSVQYVDGRDREIDRPLSNISPFEGRAGLRLKDSADGETWGGEFSARMVRHQDRLGALRIGTINTIDIIDLEERTPGFTVFNLRGYWNIAQNVHITAGVDNLFNRNYLQHLNLRLPDSGQFINTRVLEPGITPFCTVELTR